MQLHFNHDSSSGEIKIKPDSVSFSKMDNLCETDIRIDNVDVTYNKMDVNGFVNSSSIDQNDDNATLSSVEEIINKEIQNDARKSLMGDICIKAEKIEDDSNVENTQNTLFSCNIKQENCFGDEPNNKPENASESPDKSRSEETYSITIDNICIENIVSKNEVSNASEAPSENSSTVKKEAGENSREILESEKTTDNSVPNRTFDDIVTDTSNDSEVTIKHERLDETEIESTFNIKHSETFAGAPKPSFNDKDRSENHVNNDSTSTTKPISDEDDCFISLIDENDGSKTISLDRKENECENIVINDTICDIKKESDAESHSRLIHQNDAMVVVANTNTNFSSNEKDEVLHLNRNDDSGIHSKSNKDRILNDLSNNTIVEKDNDVTFFKNSSTAEENCNIKTENCGEQISNNSSKLSLIIDTLDLLLSDDEKDDKSNTKRFPTKIEKQNSQIEHLKNVGNKSEADMTNLKRDNINNKSSIKRSGNGKEQPDNITNAPHDTAVGLSEKNGLNSTTEEGESNHTKGESNASNILKKYLEENKNSQDVIFPTNFMSKFKNTFGKMTREDLEGLCVVKIVEAIVKKSNLAEADAKLRAQSKSIDVLRKTLSVVTKQNRDLELVMKNLMNEHKKRKNEVIEPVKIARSVGFQVGPSSFKIKGNKSQTQTNPPSQTSSPASLGKNPPKLVLTNTNVVVNPLIPIEPFNKKPANSKTVQTQFIASVATEIKPTNSTATISPTISKMGNNKQKFPEKRPADQSIDLTDDEPPVKLMNLGNNKIKTPTQIAKFSNGVNCDSNRVQILNPNSIPVKIYPKVQTSNPAISPLGQLRSVNINVDAGNVTKLSIPIRSSNAQSRNTFAEHPAPLPNAINGYKWKPPQPTLKISKVKNGIVVSWDIESNTTNRFYAVASYQIYAYQETSALPHSDLWKKIGDVKALPLPMACTLTQFMSGYRYYFAVRGVDVKQRLGTFSVPESILLNDDNKE